MRQRRWLELVNMTARFCITQEHHLAESRQDGEFFISSDDGLMFKRRLCIRADNRVKTELLTEAHNSPFFMHSGSTKMYQDLKRVYWWRNMDREVADFVVVDKPTKSAHFIPGISTYIASVVGLLYVRVRLVCRDQGKLVQTTNAAIQKIRAPPMKCVLRFEKKGKLSPCFVGLFEILEWIGPVAYRLASPPSFSTVHDVFHVSILRKYVADLTHVVDFEPLQINKNLSYEEQPVQILAREIKMLHNR
ncbi:ABC transporter B family member 19-like [Cucumis melo var. makuwa]|uniref:ABC transporter B family member 19-like n=1 Tax=Cucumis melo var. makuwa TaxID=1194695 RepID=A0A5A7URC9_CUCMM|nr:ABC transporter B family member 19-like [Cucumis melo var. makuwa]